MSKMATANGKPCSDIYLGRKSGPLLMLRTEYIKITVSVWPRKEVG